jgi:hypothetical protein
VLTFHGPRSPSVSSTR